jgi:hypothetical protein
MIKLTMQETRMGSFGLVREVLGKIGEGGVERICFRLTFAQNI